MKLNLLFISILLIASSFLPAKGAKHYVGGDISLLPEYEDAGAKYKTHEGEPIADLLPWLGEQGMNAMRVRLFVDPSAYEEDDADPNACQTLQYILPLCKRIKDQGMALMLDFHYSDTWADPAKQWTPAAWQGLDDNVLCEKIYEYTRDCLRTLNEAGATPDFIQPGNEISYGMLWGAPNDPEKDLKKCFMGSKANWDRLGALLSRAIAACREECPEARIVIHTERSCDRPVLKNFYMEMDRLKIDYDIIGLSYYPYFHGKLSSLSSSLTMLEKEWPGRQIMIVETGYSYKWPVPGSSEEVDYAYSDAGQAKFAHELVATLEQHPAVDGLFWWWMEYNAFGTALGNWYNAPLFDSLTGRACSALKEICSFGKDDSGIDRMPEDTLDNVTPAFNLSGCKIGKPAAGLPYIDTKGRVHIHPLY